jgi:hypothetical protein
MKWLKRKFAEWSREAWEETRAGVTLRGAVSQIATDDSPEHPPKMRFAIREALNGRFIEIATFKPQQRGSDWTVEYYLVPEGKKVSEALTLLMLMKGADDAPSR